jgi:glycosyltransferase involved in cell wall biosynthesis
MNRDSTLTPVCDVVVIPRALRILHVVPTYLPATRYGGPIWSIHGLCKAQVQAGATVHVVTTSVDGPQDSKVEHGVAVNMDGVLIHYFRSRWLRRLYFSWSLRNFLKSQIQQYDIVHLHSIFLYPTNIAARMAKRFGVPYVLAPRGMLVRELISRKSAFVKRSWLRLVERFTLRHAAAIHVTSDLELYQARELGAQLNAPKVLPNGVFELSPEPLVASKKVAGWLEGADYFIFLGRLNWSKGLDVLLGAFAAARTSMRLLIVGGDHEGYGEKLRDLCAQLAVKDSVIFTGEIHGDDKWILLQHARALVLPSISENFGNVALEAMVVGRPVVLSEGVGLADIVFQEQCGLLYSGAEEGLAKVLRKLAYEPSVADELGQRASRVARAHYSWSVIAGQSLDWYTHLLANQADV